ncbi:FUSC family protein [Actinomadura nitritigenes]|uniref:FUSC family protein n=1 Tax=Actinomadura nitritigenes TaxID=134602 RepID=UPI003D8F0CF0
MFTIRRNAGTNGGPRFRRVARTAAAPVQVQLKRLRRQATALVITRLVMTSVLAYQFASWLPGVSSRPLLAPLTALLVLQVSLYQTFRHAWQRIVSVMMGVLVAAAVSSVVGFSWWSLALVITAALILGFALRLDNYLLEVPISAMLILSLDTRAAAAERVVETLIGTVTGLVAGFVASPVQLQSAEEAIGEMSTTMTGLLKDIAAGTERGPDGRELTRWLSRARSLNREILRVDTELRKAEESVRLNPRARGMADAMVVLRECLEALEHCGISIRGLARALIDHADEPERPDRLREAETRERLAVAIRHLADAIDTYGRMSRQEFTTGSTDLEESLAEHLEQARRMHAELLDMLHDDGPDWPLHGEVLVHLDRLRAELQFRQRTRVRRRPVHRLRIPRPTPATTLSPIRRRVDLRRARS